MPDHPTAPSADAGGTSQEEIPEDLARLADAHGVAVTYLDAVDRPRTPPSSSIRAVLAAMDVPCGDEAAVASALEDVSRRRRERLVPATVVVRDDGPREIRVDPAPGEVVSGTVRTEDGTDVELDPAGSADGDAVLRLPDDVGLGAHTLVVRSGERHDEAHVLVVPARCPLPDQERSWGWQVQLYALRSSGSWGIGDLADLTRLAEVAGAEHGADFILLNPLHAPMPVVPQQDSPYYPASRRAWNPIYLRPERCDGWAAAGGEDAEGLHAAREEAQALNDATLIDRDAVHRAKDAALRILSRQPLGPERRRRFDAFVAGGGTALRDLTTAFALATRYGSDVGQWPEELRDPRSDAVAQAREEMAEEVTHQCWLQWQFDEQLAAASAAAAAAGMGVGLITDLAVGVDAAGADGWSLADDLATGVTVGSPPDPFAQKGQDWGLPPLRPDRLEASGYEAFRELVRLNLRHAGGLRIDHVMALWRLFWIPREASAAEGTYVRYDAEAMLGILALEATRAGAVVVGEDLGTVEEGVREAMAERGVLGSAVFWFEQPPGAAASDPSRARVEEYRRLALTSVSTHDLPTVAGWATDESSRVRAAADQLSDDLDDELAERRAERARLVDLLIEEGVLGPEERDDVPALIRAVHAFIGRTPSVLVAATLADAVGDLRQPNLPGTTEEYPNWRLPVATPDPDGDDVDGLLPPSRPVPLEELLADPRVAELARVIAKARGR